MDDLSLALNNSGIGGYLGDAFLNHLRPGATKGTLRRENENSFLMYYA